jgi:hypothetical protein
MLDRDIVKEFLFEKFKDAKIKIPRGIDRDALVEAFCEYVEDDYYEWLTDNYESFTNHNNPDWDWIRDKLKISR